ncbi:MAG: non-ribosomal peptide synthetase, partial [Verrucomicrobiae bacterium]|nr:non-ribosomal peptide synthetase [Verrucomicrobiae bacterium]
MWFLQEYEPESTAYTAAIAFRFSKPVDAEILKQAFQSVIDRHEILRTTFLADTDGIFQRVLERLKFKLSTDRLEVRFGEDFDTVIRKSISWQCEQPFNLGEGPLIRAHLAELPDRGHLLVILLHHIISDGWSRAILCRELSAGYQALLQGEKNPLPELSFQYADYTFWQEQQFKTEEFAESLKYWKTRLEGDLKPSQFPNDFPRPKFLSSSTGNDGVWSLDDELIAQLKELARNEGVTLYMVFLAAYNLLLHLYSGQTDIIVGSSTANRQRPEIEELIGCFINSLAIRSDLTGNPTFRSFLGQVKQTALDAFRHQSVPYERVLGELNIIRNPSHTPVFQTMFSLQDFEEATVKLGDQEGESMPIPSHTSKLELALLVEP